MKKFIITGDVIWKSETERWFYTGYSFQPENIKEFAKRETAERHIEKINKYNIARVKNTRIEEIEIDDAVIEKRKSVKKMFAKMRQQRITK